MDGMWEILISSLGILKGHDEPMRVTIIEPLGGIVGTIVKVQQTRNFADHIPHRGKTFLDPALGRPGFELKTSVVFDLWHRNRGLSGLLEVIEERAGAGLRKFRSIYFSINFDQFYVR
jgi:hypothetical protein